MTLLENDIKSIVHAIKTVTKADPMSNDRQRHNVDARFILFKICRSVLNLSLSRIGQLTNKHHATILYGCRQFDDLIVTDREFRNNYESVITLMNDVELQSKIDSTEFLSDYVTIKSKYEDLKSVHEKTLAEFVKGSDQYIVGMFYTVSNSVIRKIMEDSGCSRHLNQTLSKVLATKEIYN